MRKLIINEEGKIVSNFDVITTILNIGAGRTLPVNISKLNYPFLVNVDNSYVTSRSIEEIESIHDRFYHPLAKDPVKNSRHVYKCKHDIYEFLEVYNNKFDMITVYRFLEHVEFTNVPYFIYLLSQLLREDGLLDIIVPDYITIAKMILGEDIYSPRFEKHNILTTTELLNEPSDPHASIWTYDRIKYFFNLEERFKIEKIFKGFKFENRDIYIRAIMRRI